MFQAAHNTWTVNYSWHIWTERNNYNCDIKWKCEGPIKWQTLKLTKLVQLDKVLHKWFTAVYSEGILWPQPQLLKKLSFYDEMKIIDKCTLSRGLAAKFWLLSDNPAPAWCNGCLITGIPLYIIYNDVFLTVNFLQGRSMLQHNWLYG